MIYAMRMYTQVFDQMSDLNKFVNSRGIKQEQIVEIFQDKENQFTLVYYAE